MKNSVHILGEQRLVHRFGERIGNFIRGNRGGNDCPPEQAATSETKEKPNDKSVLKPRKDVLKEKYTSLRNRMLELKRSEGWIRDNESREKTKAREEKAAQWGKYIEQFDAKFAELESELQRVAEHQKAPVLNRLDKILSSYEGHMNVREKERPAYADTVPHKTPEELAADEQAEKAATLEKAVARVEKNMPEMRELMTKLSSMNTATKLGAPEQFVVMQAEELLSQLMKDHQMMADLGWAGEGPNGDRAMEIAMEELNGYKDLLAEANEFKSNKLETERVPNEFIASSPAASSVESSREADVVKQSMERVAWDAGKPDLPTGEANAVARAELTHEMPETVAREPGAGGFDIMTTADGRRRMERGVELPEDVMNRLGITDDKGTIVVETSEDGKTIKNVMLRRNAADGTTLLEIDMVKKVDEAFKGNKITSGVMNRLYEATNEVLHGQELAADIGEEILHIASMERRTKLGDLIQKIQDSTGIGIGTSPKEESFDAHVATLDALGKVLPNLSAENLNVMKGATIWLKGDITEPIVTFDGKTIEIPLYGDNVAGDVAKVIDTLNKRTIGDSGFEAQVTGNGVRRLEKSIALPEQFSNGGHEDQNGAVVVELESDGTTVKQVMLKHGTLLEVEHALPVSEEFKGQTVTPDVLRKIEAKMTALHVS